MRFRRLHARVFGPLRDAELEFDAKLVLVHGSNESGKSSLKSALETTLYGFEPASRETHPLYRWDESAGNLHLEAELALDNGRVAGVERVLQATGKSRTREAGEPFEGTRQGNAALACVSHLPRPVYRSIYSLELEQLTALESSVQLNVDDLLLPECQALDLRPASQVRTELLADHRALWRPDNRGRPAARQLREQVAEARARVGEATERERELRQARREAYELAGRLRQARERKREIELIRDDAPYLRQLFEWNARCRRLGRPIEGAQLAGVRLIRPDLLDAEITSLEEELAPARARLDHPAQELEEAHRPVLETAAEIEVALGAAPALDSDRARLQERREGAELLRSAARRELGSILQRPPAEPQLDAARELPLEALRAHQASWAAAWRDRVQAPPPAPRRGPLWLGVGLGVAGLLVAGAVALGRLLPVFSALGAGLLCLAGLAAFRARAQPPAREEEPPPRPQGCDALLAALPLHPELLASPEGLLRAVEALARAQAALQDAEGADGSAHALELTVDAHERERIALCARLGVPEAGGAPLQLAQLRDALQRAQAQQRLDGARPSWERLTLQHRRLLEFLKEVEPEERDPCEAFDRAEARIGETRFLRERQAELAADPRFDALRRDARVAGERPPPDASWLPEETAKRDGELRELDASIEADSQRLGELRRMLGDAEAAAAARARDDLLAAEEQLARSERERDRLALLEAVVARAERDFREEHQPDVLRRASGYLERVTHGRYTRLEYRSEQEGGLHVHAAARDEPVPVAHPLSRGTLDQIFLCLRLGLLDHLDADSERLPLVLDDALLRMDDARRAEVYALLRELGPRRQVFLLTCHEAIAAEAERALGIRRLPLG